METDSPLDDTSNCPKAKQCEACGNEGDDLAVETAKLDQLGVMYLTLCDPCIEKPLPNVNIQRAAHRSALHAGHVGLDLDQVAEILEAEKAAERSDFGL